MTDLEFEYADYCINTLRNSCQAFDDIDWRDQKSQKYDERLNYKQQAEIRAILSGQGWIEKHSTLELYRLNNSKTVFLIEHGSYSNYCKSLDKETQLLKSKLADKLQLETEVLKLQKENLEKSSKIRLDVFEIVNRQPILNYRISVVDRVIISIDNKEINTKSVSKIIDLLVRENLEIFELPDDEKLGFGNQMTHKFKIKSFGKIFLFLNLTDNDLIKLGFKEKPKTRLQKLIDFSLNGFWLWLERIGYLLAIPLAIIAFRQCSIDSKNQKLKSQQEIKPSQTNSRTNSTDTTYILKTDSLTKN